MTFEELFRTIEFKDPKDKDNMTEIHHLLFAILLDMASWHRTRGYSMVITDLISTKEEDSVLQRESDSHRTRRAADLRSRHMELEDQNDFVRHFNKKYESLASVSRSDLKPRLVVLHGSGNNRHFHVALNYKYRIVK